MKTYGTPLLAAFEGDFKKLETMSQQEKIMNQSQVHKLFLYNPTTGKLTQNLPHGKEVGCLTTAGYRVVTIQRKQYQISRIIWMWMTGEFPTDTIDHKDRVRDNNVWTNLRNATLYEQNMNRSAVGVRQLASGNFEASIQHRGTREYLGCAFPTYELAKVAYDTRKSELVGNS